MYSISEAAYAEQSVFQSIKHFCREFGVGKALKRAGVYKSKGIGALNIILYLVFLAYSGKTMNRDVSGRNSTIGDSNDAVYRFLREQTVNWNTFLLAVGGKIAAFMNPLTSEARKTALVIDDTLNERPYSKKTELVARVFDHVDKKYKRGFRTLFAAWTDGASLVPLCFRHMSSAEAKNRYVPERAGLDKRTCSAKTKKEAQMKATEVCLLLLARVKRFLIPAKYVLFDCWFAFPAVITKIKGMGYEVTCRVKKMRNVFYFFEDTKLTLKQIFDRSKKRRGKSRYLLSVEIYLLDADDERVPCRLVYVRNKKKRNDWIAVLTTDTELSPEEVIELYGKRWSIEVFFKACKSYLRFTGEFQQTSYEAVTAHTAIVALRYMILSVGHRRQTDHRTIGELVYDAVDEARELTFRDVMAIIMAALVNALTEEIADFDAGRVRKFMDAFISGLPTYIRRLLAPDFVALNWAA
jgi:hypothetical protein